MSVRSVEWAKFIALCKGEAIRNNMNKSRLSASQTVNQVKINHCLTSAEQKADLRIQHEHSKI